MMTNDEAVRLMGLMVMMIELMVMVTTGGETDSDDGWACEEDDNRLVG